jgi:UDP-3-O-[3-hydroxymyristoyl] glucosamine N-acyltransferase
MGLHDFRTCVFQEISLSDPNFINIAKHSRERDQRNLIAGCFVDCRDQLEAPAAFRRIDPTAHIHPSARLAEDVSVGRFAIIGEGAEIGAGTVIHDDVVIGRGCTIGEQAVLHSGAILYDDCLLGSRVVVHAGSVLGADGFGYRKRDTGYTKVPQLGGVEVGDQAVIGPRTTIDRGTFGPTRIGAGTQLNESVMVGHNCRIGPRNTIDAQTGIAGSTSTGETVTIGRHCGIVGHIHLGDRAVIADRTGASKSIPPDRVIKPLLVGFPGQPGKLDSEPEQYVEYLFELCEELDEIKRRLSIDFAEDRPAETNRE